MQASKSGVAQAVWYFLMPVEFCYNRHDMAAHA